MTLGEKIRELRAKMDLSLRELAKKVEVTAPFLSDIELGRRYPSEEKLLSLSKQLGVSVEELRTYDTRPPIEGLKRLANSDPKYALFFRQVIDEEISSEDLLKFVEENKKK